MIIQGRKEQNQGIIKHEITGYTEACYFAMKIGRKHTNKGRNEVKIL